MTSQLEQCHDVTCSYREYIGGIIFPVLEKTKATFNDCTHGVIIIQIIILKYIKKDTSVVNIVFITKKCFQYSNYIIFVHFISNKNETSEIDIQLTSVAHGNYTTSMFAVFTSKKSVLSCICSVANRCGFIVWVAMVYWHIQRYESGPFYWNNRKSLKLKLTCQNSEIGNRSIFKLCKNLSYL